MSDSPTEMLVNRVRKRTRTLRKWATREGVTCWRLYDADIPELPLQIDWYQGTRDGKPAMALHVTVAAERGVFRGDDRPDRTAREMVAAVTEASSQRFPGIERASVSIKIRHRRSGKRNPYHKRSDVPDELIVEEGGLRFVVDMSRYHDTGLFLDHRATRAEVASMARGKRVLNLFAYTGSFSVYAAAAGARTTTTVDLSRTYLDWTQRNFELNDMRAGQWPQPMSRGKFPPKPPNIVLRADSRHFLAEAARRNERYDLAVVDPPTYSASSRMEGDFDIQRDHMALIEETLAVLAPGGTLWFSNNMRKFEWLGEYIDGAKEIVEITSTTAPPDFHGTPHRCWRITAAG